MYLNVREVESALQVAESNHPAIIRRFALPNETYEGRLCHAVKIAHGSGSDRVGICFVGGLHAREWIPPDALINFVEVIARAYQTNTDITIGRNNFLSSDIVTLLSKIDIFVFPQVNPDGRNSSQTIPSEIMWRKNKRDNGDGTVGVDINRNFNFLWNYPLYFDPAAPIVSSIVSSRNTFIGPEPNSEPETRNVIHILNSFSNIKYFIDVHSFSELLLFDWGNDESQSSNSIMNFQNFTYYGQIGIRGDSYREYVEASDSSLRRTLCDSMRQSIQNVRGRNYSVQSSFELYPTSGTSANYVDSRSYVNPSLGKVHGFTIECGTEFMPELPEREQVINEVTAALLRFCFDVCQLPVSTETYVKQLIIQVEVGNDGIRGQDAAGTSHLLGDLFYRFDGIDRQDLIELNNIGTRSRPNWRGWGTGNHAKIYDLANEIPIQDIERLILYMPAAGGLFGDNADIDRVRVQALSVDNNLCDIGSIDGPFRFTGANERMEIRFSGCV